VTLDIINHLHRIPAYLATPLPDHQIPNSRFQCLKPGIPNDKFQPEKFNNCVRSVQEADVYVDMRVPRGSLRIMTHEHGWVQKDIGRWWLYIGIIYVRTSVRNWKLVGCVGCVDRGCAWMYAQFRWAFVHWMTQNWWGWYFWFDGTVSWHFNPIWFWGLSIICLFLRHHLGIGMRIRAFDECWHWGNGRSCNCIISYGIGDYVTDLLEVAWISHTYTGLLPYINICSNGLIR